MVKYFLGSSCSEGFFSLFDELTPLPESGYLFVLKGGPGTGKSTLMKKLASCLEERGIPCERICCSSDPQSLDAVILSGHSICVADGTSPHVIEPQYPGVAGEIINLGNCWRDGLLQSERERIVRLTDSNAQLHRRCRRFLDAAFAVRSDAYKLMLPCVDSTRLSRYASRTASRLFPAPNGKIGHEHKRLLDAVTPDGYIFLNETANELCGRKIIFREEFACTALLLIDELRRYAIGNGLDVITSPCISGSTGCRHLIIPELSLGFFSSDCLCKPELEEAKTVSARRLCNTQALAACRARTAFAKKASAEMLSQAVEALSSAKQVHDELEKCYINAMDFGKLDEIYACLFDRILALAKGE